MPKFNPGEYSSQSVQIVAAGSATVSSSCLYVKPKSTSAATTTYFTYYDAPILTGSGTTASTIVVAGAPIGGTITNRYSINVLSGPIITADTTAATSTSSGAIVVAGGIGVAGDLYVGGTLNLSESSSAFTTPSGPTTISGPFFSSSQLISANTNLSTTLGGRLIVVNTASVVLTLPAISVTPKNGIEYFIVNTSSGTITINVANNVSEFIDGTYSTISLSQNDRAHLIAYGVNWYTF